MRVPVVLADPVEPSNRIEIPSALIDTGATWTVVPRRYAGQLALPVVGQWIVRTAAGDQTLDQSQIWIELQGKRLLDAILITDTYPEPVIGVTTLERMGFAVDPVNKRLMEQELLLL